MSVSQSSLQETARRELVRALALTIAYRAAVDDDARGEVVAQIGGALENALVALERMGWDGVDVGRVVAPRRP